MRMRRRVRRAWERACCAVRCVFGRAHIASRLREAVVGFKHAIAALAVVNVVARAQQHLQPTRRLRLHSSSPAALVVSGCLDAHPGRRPPPRSTGAPVVVCAKSRSRASLRRARAAHSDGERGDGSEGEDGTRGKTNQRSRRQRTSAKQSCSPFACSLELSPQKISYRPRCLERGVDPSPAGDFYGVSRREVHQLVKAPREMCHFVRRSRRGRSALHFTLSLGQYENIIRSKPCQPLVSSANRKSRDRPSALRDLEIPAPSLSAASAVGGGPAPLASKFGSTLGPQP